MISDQIPDDYERILREGGYAIIPQKNIDHIHAQNKELRELVFDLREWKRMIENKLFHIYSLIRRDLQ